MPTTTRSRTQVCHLLGRGTQMGAEYKHRVTVNYGKRGLYVQSGSGKAIGIVTSNPAYTTAKDIGVGRSTQADVQAAYPAAHCIVLT